MLHAASMWTEKWDEYGLFKHYFKLPFLTSSIIRISVILLTAIVSPNVVLTAISSNRLLIFSLNLKGEKGVLAKMEAQVETLHFLAQPKEG